MEIFILSFVIFLLAAIGMALGAVVTGVELRGTCAALTQANFNGTRCDNCPLRLLRRECARRRQTRTEHESSANPSLRDRELGEP